MDTLQMEFGKMVRKYRKEKGYSTQKLAELLGVSVGLVNNIENGKSDVFKIGILSQIFEILNIPSKDILKILFCENILNDLEPINDSNKKLFYNLPLDYRIDIIKRLDEILSSYMLILSKYNQDNKIIDFINTFITMYSNLIIYLFNYLLNDFNIDKKYHEV